MKISAGLALPLAALMMATTAFAQDLDTALETMKKEGYEAIAEVNAASAAMKAKDVSSACQHMTRAYNEYGEAIASTEAVKDIVRNDTRYTVEDRNGAIAELDKMRDSFVDSRAQVQDGWNRLCQ